MLKTYIGPRRSVRIVIAGEDYGCAEQGQAIVVPDDVANSVAWPEGNWRDGAPDKANQPDNNDASEGDK